MRNLVVVAGSSERALVAAPTLLWANPGKLAAVPRPAVQPGRPRRGPVPPAICSARATARSCSRRRCSTSSGRRRHADDSRSIAPVGAQPPAEQGASPARRAAGARSSVEREPARLRRARTSRADPRRRCRWSPSAPTIRHATGSTTCCCTACLRRPGVEVFVPKTQHRQIRDATLDLRIELARHAADRRAEACAPCPPRPARRDLARPSPVEADRRATIQSLADETDTSAAAGKQAKTIIDAFLSKTRAAR